MPTHGGEEPPAKGRQFDDAATSLLVALGYKVVLRNRHGFDAIFDPPKRSDTSVPLLFAPSNRTAFEYKSGRGPTIESLAKTLRSKVRQAFRSSEASVRKTRSGIGIVEGYVSDDLKRKIADKFSISVWDIRTILFLISKTTALVSDPRNKPIEEILDTSTSVVYETRPYGRSMRFSCSIFYQHPFDQLGIERLGSILEQLTNKLGDIAKRLSMPTYVTVEVFALSGFSGEITQEAVEEMLEAQSAGRLIYDSEGIGLHSFETAPWSFLIMGASL
jgi:hypothetical protein